ncbi:MAG: hypothetical protein DRN17_04545 [Thermoplasmata archaeon]|nr:MAG: hypothetical protein DRN17_04545 [Thermoplasmata archaeon]
MLRSKGDYMKAAKEMDSRIKEMDSAIPIGISKHLYDLGIDPSMMVMVYWTSGKQEVVNIVAHWALLTNSK